MAALGVELLGGAKEPDASVLHEIRGIQTVAPKAPGDGDDQVSMSSHELAQAGKAGPVDGRFHPKPGQSSSCAEPPSGAKAAESMGNWADRESAMPCRANADGVAFRQVPYAPAGSRLRDAAR
jgi:hypothetical protein